MSNVSSALLIGFMVGLVIFGVIALSVKSDECDSKGKVMVRTALWYTCVSR